MNELYTKIYAIEDELNQLPIFNEIYKIINQIKDNKEYQQKIEKYHLFPNEKLRMDIYSYEEIRNYKEKETELNLLILNINKRIKKGLLEKDVDCHESN